MGKIARRSTAAGALVLAGALAFSTAAAANIDGSPINVDGDPDTVTQPGDPDVWRFADADRVGTALQAAQRTELPWGDTVIIANSSVFADALAAAPLADALDAPVLLNAPGNSLRGDVLNYATSAFSNVILVGGTDVFGNAVRTALEDEGVSVDRVEGANRYQTAVQLAGAAIDAAGYEDNVNIFLADGLNFPDALAAGAAAAENSGVVLLTQGDDRIDAVTYGAITENSFALPHESIIAVGGPAAAAAASGHQGDPIEVNHSHIGDNRYETAVQVAEEYLSDATNFVVASGQHFADAVVGGAYAANVDGALLLTRPQNLTHATADHLESIRLDVENVFVFGGPDSVQPHVSQQIADLDWQY